VRVDDTNFTYLKTLNSAPLKVGDIFAILETNPTPVTNDDRDIANLRLYRVHTVVDGGTTWNISIDASLENNVIYRSVSGTEDAYQNGDSILAWTPIIESDIKVDFRAVRTSEIGVVKRIVSVEDIADAWTRDGEIRLHNELAFMASIMYGSNGGTVFYGVHIDATAENISAEYADALEELKLKDVYSHAIGSTDGGVNALMGPYCDGQAEPYEGHERIAVLCYDEDDIFLIGSDACTVADTGIITLSGTFDPIATGLTVDDEARLYDDEGNLVATVTVTETPDPGSPTLVQTDYSGTALGSGHTVRFLSGRKDDQAIRAGAIQYGNRRITTIWPGWFTAEFGGELFTLPPYYITAAIAGMDSNIPVAQSFTNMTFSIPGLSNISLNTNHYYRKLDLDEIGAGGVDIMIQDAAVSQSIKSRHDLTSNMDAILYRERSITKQADVAAKTIRAAIAPYVGRYNITKELFGFLGQVISIVIDRLQRENVLASIELKNIARDEVIVDKINIVLEATVFVAGNYYDVTLIVKS